MSMGCACLASAARQSWTSSGSRTERSSSTGTCASRSRRRRPTRTACSRAGSGGRLLAFSGEFLRVSPEGRIEMTDKPIDRPVVNVADVALTENRHGDRFLARLGRIGAAIGLTGLGCTLHVVPPGKRAFPFHAHHVADELFFILSGEGRSEE